MYMVDVVIMLNKSNILWGVQSEWLSLPGCTAHYPFLPVKSNECSLVYEETIYVILRWVLPALICDNCGVPAFVSIRICIVAGCWVI